MRVVRRIGVPDTATTARPIRIAPGPFQKNGNREAGSFLISSPPPTFFLETGATSLLVASCIHVSRHAVSKRSTIS